MKKKTIFPLCIFCGNNGETREHLVPKWLHKHYNLKDKRIKLRNSTSIAYSQAILPACKECNNIRLSALENKVKNGVASLQDYYNWALKIQFSLSFKDTFLFKNIKNKEEGYIMTKDDAHKDLAFSTLIFKNLSNEKFTYFPNPLGSVFLTKIVKNTKNEFALVDIGYPYRILSISLPSGYILTVLFIDKGLVKKFVEINGINLFSDSINILTDNNFSTNMIAQYISYLLMKIQYRIKIPKGYSQRKNGISSLRMPKKIKQNFFIEKNILIDMARKCGLPDSVANLDFENQKNIIK